jgi:hypothetical protein
MFEFLNKVFGRAVEVEVVGYNPPEVRFKSKDPLPLGVNDVHATIAGVKLKARVQVVESGVEISQGFWLAPAEAIPYLEEIFTHNEKRKVPRFARTLRVRSSQLDGFQGSSLDLSLEGLRLEGQGGKLVPGGLIDLQMDLDDARETTLNLQAHVRWCAPAVAESRVVAGLEFADFDGRSEGYAHYTLFLERLAQSEKPLPEQ